MQGVQRRKGGIEGVSDMGNKRDQEKRERERELPFQNSVDEDLSRYGQIPMFSLIQRHQISALSVPDIFSHCVETSQTVGAAV